MNKYYHEFTIGFNWWMIIAIVAVIISVVLVLVLAKRRKGYDTYDDFDELSKFFAIVASFMSGIWTSFFVVESYAGVVQWFDNHNDVSTSGAWSELLAFPAMLLCGLLFTFLLYAIMESLYGVVAGYDEDTRRELPKSKEEISKEKFRKEQRRQFDAVVAEFLEIIDKGGRNNDNLRDY